MLIGVNSGKRKTEIVIVAIDQLKLFSLMNLTVHASGIFHLSLQISFSFPFGECY